MAYFTYKVRTTLSRKAIIRRKGAMSKIFNLDLLTLTYLQKKDKAARHLKRKDDIAKYIAKYTIVKHYQ